MPLMGHSTFSSLYRYRHTCAISPAKTVCKLTTHRLHSACGKLLNPKVLFFFFGERFQISKLCLSGFSWSRGEPGHTGLFYYTSYDRLDPCSSHPCEGMELSVSSQCPPGLLHSCSFPAWSPSACELAALLYL